jgi:hypothetical protein
MHDQEAYHFLHSLVTSGLPAVYESDQGKRVNYHEIFERIRADNSTLLAGAPQRVARSFRRTWARKFLTSQSGDGEHDLEIAGLERAYTEVRREVSFPTWLKALARILPKGIEGVVCGTERMVIYEDVGKSLQDFANYMMKNAPNPYFGALVPLYYRRALDLELGVTKPLVGEKTGSSVNSSKLG